MSIRVASSSWIAGAVVVGDPGFGVLAETIPSTGEHGPGYAYPSLEFPTDAGKEIAGRVTTWPTLGTLVAYEDTSFTYDGASDTFAFQLYADGVTVGTPQTVTITVGEVVHVAEGALTGASSIIGSATRFRAHAAEGAIAAGQAQINGASTHIGVVVHEASGALTGAASVVGKAAAKHLHRCSGAIAAGPAVINGTVVSKHIHTCAGALVGSAEINGTTTHTGVVAGEVTLSAQTIADIVSAVLAAINATTIPVDVRKVVGTTVSGSGTESDPWGP